jgi:hypothetical protein
VVPKSDNSGPRRPSWISGASLALLLALVAIGCGASKDDRDEVMARYGEPDDKLLNEGPFADAEIWYYSNFDSSGVEWCFEFQRSRNTCGGATQFQRVSEGTGLCSFYFNVP